MSDLIEQPVRGRLKKKRRRRRILRWILWPVGICLLAIVFAAFWKGLVLLGMVPNPYPLPQERLHPSIEKRLLRNGVLEEDEKLLCFFAENPLTLSAGSLCTNKRVIAYEECGDHMQICDAYYDDIVGVVLEPFGVGSIDSPMANSTITVTRSDGSWLTLCTDTDPITKECKFRDVVEQQRSVPTAPGVLDSASPIVEPAS